MERRIVFATGNQNKMAEMRMILKDLGMPVYSMQELGIDEDITEDGILFEENAEIKARAVARLLPQDIVLADDSGLEIDYLDGAPGIYSTQLRGEARRMILKTGSFWISWRVFQMKSVRLGLYVRSQLYFRTGV